MGPSGKIRVVVVEGDNDLRSALCRRLAEHPFVAVVGSARDCTTAIPRIAAIRPDWVVVDLAADPIGGLSLLEVMHDARLHTQSAVIAEPTDVAVPGVVAEARRQGVACVVRRLPGSADAMCERLVRDLLVPILRAPAAPRVDGPSTPLSPQPSSATNTPARPAVPTSAAAPPEPQTRPAPKVVGIGVSTGGPAALNQLLPQLPRDFPLPILIVQHMPASFTKGLAESLDRVSNLRVREAVAGDPVRAGEVLIAPGGRHLRVAGRSVDARVEVTDDAPVCSCRPSVDYLFESLVHCFGRRTLGVVLTGMGEDGWLGSRAIHAAGGLVLAQDEASSTVWGMPRGPIEAGVARSVPLATMAQAILRLAAGGGVR